MSGSPLQCVTTTSPRLKRVTSGAGRDHLADRTVAGIDLAAAQLGDVDRVGEDGVIDVVLERHGQNAQVDVARTHRAQGRFVQPDDARGVELGQIVVDPSPLGRNGLAGDRIRARHDILLRVACGRYASERASPLQFHHKDTKTLRDMRSAANAW